MSEPHDDRSLLAGLIGDGRPLLAFTGLSLVLAGLFALFIAGTGHFLPHDAAYLGLTSEQLCAYHECRVVHFMIHDRFSFGGAITAVGLVYLWLVEFPLKARQAWAWWLLCLSGAAGFASFLTYLGYGYLDTWHGAATLALLPAFAVGLIRSWFTLGAERRVNVLAKRGWTGAWRSREGIGRLLLLLCAGGMIGGGSTIMFLGMTWVFVPEDLAFMRVQVEQLQAINDRLIPLIAHDRAGFGGGVCCAGVLLLGCAWCAPPSRSLWQVLALAGLFGFGSAIAVHPAIGYTDPFHLLPPLAGVTLFAGGLIVCWRTRA